MFGAIAPQYDRLNHLLSMNVDRYWRWRTTRLAKLQNQRDPILDICTGTGDLALALQRHTRGRTPIVAADFCREMLVIGQQKSRRRGAKSSIRFVAADAQQLPFRDNQFQLVSVAFGLRNVSDTDRGLVEMTRVCQPGGQVAVLEFSMPERQPIKAIYAWYFRHVLPRIGQLVSRSRHLAYEYLPQSVGEFPSGEALAERMRAAGLRDVHYHPLTFGIATLYLGTK